MTETELRNQVVSTAKKYYGCKESNGSHKQIIDIYNAHKPLARGYAVKYTDAWCATFVSTISILCNITDILPTECGCGKQIDIFKTLSCWVEQDSYIPKPGDVIYYDLDDLGSGDNTGGADHVGIVTACDGSTITVIEGNMSDAVGYRSIKVNARYIRGFGVPNYARKATAETPKVEPPKVETHKFVTVAGFQDIPECAWYIDAIKWAAENGITSGKDSTHFAPLDTCTRAEAVTFLWRSFGKPVHVMAYTPFDDVKPSAWYNDAVCWALEHGITQGTDTYTFSPDEACTRAQVVTMLWRAAGSPEPAGYQPFTDVQPASWYAKAVQWAVDEAITNGTDGSHFSPDAPCTRAEMVTFLYRKYMTK